VARIRSVARQGNYRVSIRGALSVRDLGRLERACGPAIEQINVPLDIRMKVVTGMDEEARTFLHQLVSRGAIIFAP